MEFPKITAILPPFSLIATTGQPYFQWARSMRCPSAARHDRAGPKVSIKLCSDAAGATAGLVTASTCGQSLRRPVWFAGGSRRIRTIFALRTTCGMGQKVSDEFTVPLCQGHHRELHRSGDEVAMDGVARGSTQPRAARTLWLESHPLPGINSSDAAGIGRKR